MRQAGTLPSESDAQRFADYLLTQGITTRIDSADEGCTIWIREEDHLDRAREELEAFRRSPDDDRYSGAARTARQLRQENLERERRYRKNLIDVRQKFNSPTGTAPLTMALIGISVVVTLLIGFDFTGPVGRWLMITPVNALSGNLVERLFYEVLRGQVWRLVTPIFMHGDILHLLFNMLWLYSLGRMVEMRRGAARYLGLVLLIAVLSNVAQYVFGHHPNFGGMSGVVLGLFGYVWMQSRYEPSSGFYLPAQTVFFMLAYLGIMTIGRIGGIAHWAHGVGLATGMLIGIGPHAIRHLFR